MDLSFVTILSIGAMLIGSIFALVYPQQDRRHGKAVGVFALGAAVLVTTWFLEYPDRLPEVHEQLALALIGIIFVFIEVIKRRGR